MKIKTVCEITGLTSRAIRVYIDEKLIDPRFSENYLGRRSFDFSEDDIIALKNIAVLRKYGFSIDDIRKILLDTQNSIEVIESVKCRTHDQLEEYSERLNALSCLEENKAYSFSELSEVLSRTETDAKTPIDSGTILKGIVRIFKSIAIFIAVWLPFALCLFSICLDLTTYAYPKLSVKFILLTVLTLIPSISFLALSKTNLNCKKTIKIIVLCFCIVSVPFSFIFPFGIVKRSETSDFRNYRKFDPDCLASRDDIFQELFPQWPNYFENVKNEHGEFETVYLDAKYYYQFFYGMDYTFDIYAEWPLNDEEFVTEVIRVKEVFEKRAPYVEITKGDYSCLIMYEVYNVTDKPFEKVTDNYTYYIFAYNEKTNTVRYIYCSSLENGVDQPYYLQLDW